MRFMHHTKLVANFAGGNKHLELQEFFSLKAPGAAGLLKMFTSGEIAKRKQQKNKDDEEEQNLHSFDKCRSRAFCGIYVPAVYQRNAYH